MKKNTLLLSVVRSFVGEPEKVGTHFLKAAFYGSKLSGQLKKSNSKSWVLSSH